MVLSILIDIPFCFVIKVHIHVDMFFLYITCMYITRLHEWVRVQINNVRSA